MILYNSLKFINWFKKEKRVDIGGFYLQAHYVSYPMVVGGNRMYIMHKSFYSSRKRPPFSHFRNNCSIKKDLNNGYTCSKFYISFSRL